MPTVQDSFNAERQGGLLLVMKIASSTGRWALASARESAPSWE
jgi:hypothetical protein